MVDGYLKCSHCELRTWGVGGGGIFKRQMTDGCSQHSPAPPGDPKKKGHIAQAVFSDLRPTALKTWQLTLQEALWTTP